MQNDYIKFLGLFIFGWIFMYMLLAVVTGWNNLAKKNNLTKPQGPL